MKRQKYLFRAKYIDSNEWVYGGGVWQFERACAMICEDHHGEIVIKPVQPETVGMFSGLKDNCRHKIFEGDIVQGPLGSIFEVIFSDGCFSLIDHKSNPVKIQPFKNDKCQFEIIGNTTENPYLLEAIECQS